MKTYDPTRAISNPNVTEVCPGLEDFICKNIARDDNCLKIYLKVPQRRKAALCLDPGKLLVRENPY